MDRRDLPATPPPERRADFPKGERAALYRDLLGACCDGRAEAPEWLAERLAGERLQ